MDWRAVNLANWEERAKIHLRSTTGAYVTDEVLAGGSSLHVIEATEIDADLSGRRIAHLQCHFGLDSLSLARRGARVDGLDFSATAVAAARDLAARTGLPARFFEGDVYDARALLDGSFDGVYVTWGAINWLPDIRRWAAVAASLLAPGGWLYLAESHPSTLILEEIDGRLEATYAWRTPRDLPIITEEATTYTGDPDLISNRRTCEWIHPLSEILGGLLEAGLALEFLNEHELLPYRLFPSLMVEAGGRMYRLRDGVVPMPLAFSLRMRKPA